MNEDVDEDIDDEDVDDDDVNDDDVDDDELEDDDVGVLADKDSWLLDSNVT